MNGDPISQHSPGSVIPTPGQMQKYRSLGEAARALTQAINQSHEVLATAKTVFPFKLFTDTVTIDREKLTVTHREFFMTGEVVSIRLQDILSVLADVGPFFGTIKVITRFFNADNPYVVGHLRRHDALTLKRIAQGAVIAQQKQIDTSTLTTTELTRMLEELGR